MNNIRKLFFLLFTTGAALLPLLSYSQVGKKISYKKIDVLASVVCEKGGSLTPVKEGSNAKLEKREDGGIDAKFEARSTRWRTMNFAFVANDNCSVVLSLKGTSQHRSAFFDNVKLNGKLLSNGDFQNGLENWQAGKKSKKKPSISQGSSPKFGGDVCAEVPVGASLTRKLSFKKGEKVLISIESSYDDEWRDCSLVDISSLANANYKGDLTPSTIPPYKGMRSPKNPVNVSGMKFKIISPKDNDNKTIIYPALNVGGTVIDLEKNPIKGKYLYLLHSVADGSSNSIGKILINFKDGRTKNFNVVHAVDVGWVGDKKAYDNALPVYVDDKKSGKGTVYMSKFDTKGGDALGEISKITFSSSKPWLIFGATVSSREVETTENFVFDPNVWKPVAGESYEVVAGSALDLSDAVEAPAGKYGRVIVGKSGNFEFSNRPDVPVRFKAANFFGLIGRFGNSIKTHEEIDKYVKMLKKQGFNAIRWRFVMGGEFSAPYVLKPLNEDLYDYFLYALGREGIYSFFYICSHHTGDPSFTWNDRFTVKVKMMLGDKPTREAWRKLAKMQLEHVNPYTKKAWKDDPSIATIEYWNEFELGIVVYTAITEEGRKLVNQKFAEYLAKRYKDVPEFLAACEREGTPWIFDGDFTKFEQIDMSKSHTNRAKNPIFARFVLDAMVDMQDFCKKVVRDEIGMTAPAHQNNCLGSLLWTYLSTVGGDYTAINTYHSHPSSYDLGATVGQTSSIEKNLISYWRKTAGKRIAGMPIAVTEYQHCYFNKFAHEAGVVFPAYSALQGFDALVAFDSPVAEEAGRMGFFSIGTNPVFRASDFLTHFLFARGDVARSPKRTDIIIDKSFVEKSPDLPFGLNQEQVKISLMTGFAVAFPDVVKTKVKPADMSLAPIGASAIVTEQQFSSAGETFGKKFKVDDIVPIFKKRGVLPNDNISDPKNGIFQSDTGEITMRAKERELTVVTPKSVAAVVNETTKPMSLGALAFESFSAKGTLAVVSIDNKPLVDSSRMVLVISTDTVPTDAKYSNTRLRISTWGKAPALIETAKLSAKLKVAQGKKFVVYPLKISGERLAPISVENANGVLNLDIDTSKNPSLYFEIVAN